MRLKKSALAAVVLLVSGVAGYVATSSWQVARASSDGAADAPATALEGVPEPQVPFTGGTHLITYVLTSTSCGWSTRPEMLEAIGQLREQMRQVHGESFAQVSVVGLLLDMDLDTGLEFLADIRATASGPVFDQVSVGDSWLNENAVRLLWRDRITTAAVPQILVVKRQVGTESYLADGSLSVGDDVIVTKVVGNVDIANWLMSGTPLEGEGSVARATPSRDRTAS